MAVDWRTFFDDLVTKSLASWPNVGNAIKGQVYDFVLKWATGDRAQFKQAIEKALQDNKLTEKEIIGLLAVMAEGWTNDSFFGNAYIQRILQALEDGNLTTREIAEVAAVWLTDQTKDDLLKKLIKVVSDGQLTRDEVEDAILGWLTRIGQDPLAQALRQLLDDPNHTVDTREIILLVAVWLASNGQLAPTGYTLQKQMDALLQGINALQQSDLVQILQAIVDKDYAKAARLVLLKLGITVEDAIIKAVLNGKIDAVAKEFLAGVLGRSIKGIKGDQAAALADTIIKVLSGKLDLIPAQDERQEFFKQYQMGYTDIIDPAKCPFTEYQLFVIVRNMLYAAQRSLAVGAAVPTDPQARPYSFAAASIQPDTIVKSLVTDSNQRKMFLAFYQMACIEEFRQLPNGGRFSEALPLTEDQFNKGETALQCFIHVSDFLLA